MPELQKLIDAVAYPPTHTYRLVDGADPAPGELLLARINVMRQVAPSFFKPGPHLFLDVGCNKGFFCLLAKHRFPQVVGIDPVGPFVDLCRALIPTGVFERTGFRDYKPRHRFDRVMIGNGHHHLFKEAHGWGWVAKLAAICREGCQVLIEGVDREDGADGVPGMKPDDFFAAMGKYFALLDAADSPSYTPNRRVTLWLRRSGIARYRICQQSSEILRRGDVCSGSAVAPRWHKAHVTRNGDRVSKVFTPPTPTPLWPRVEIASYMVGVNPLMNWLDDGTELVGWSEPFLQPSTAQPQEVGRLLLQHGVNLARVGYAETDFASINVMQGQHGPLIVDKNGVYHCSELTQGHFDYVNGSLATSLRANGMCEKHIVDLCAAYATRNSNQIEAALLTVLLGARK